MSRRQAEFHGLRPRAVLATALGPVAVALGLASRFADDPHPVHRIVIVVGAGLSHLVDQPVFLAKDQHLQAAPMMIRRDDRSALQRASMARQEPGR